MKYVISYGDGTYETVDGKLSTAMEIADANAKFTERTLSIYTVSGKRVAMRYWFYTLLYVDVSKNPIKFGENGFYADWEVFSDNSIVYVKHLYTNEVKAFLSIPLRLAVISAYAQSIGDWEAWNYNKYDSYIHETDHTVTALDWTTLKENKPFE